MKEMRKGKRIKKKRKTKKKNKEKEKRTERPKNTPAPPFLLSPFRHGRRKRNKGNKAGSTPLPVQAQQEEKDPFAFAFTFTLSFTFAFLLPPTFAAAASFDLSGEGEEIGIFIFDRAGERFCEKKPVSVRRSIPATVITRSCPGGPRAASRPRPGPSLPAFCPMDSQIGNLRQISTNAANRVGKRLQVCYTCPAE